jgi:hypothetical protein
VIRIGSSCALSEKMAVGKVVETRRFIGSYSNWESVARYCIKNNIYLIVTLCINRNDGSGHVPDRLEWESFVSDTCERLISFGGNTLNARLSVINEPMKFCSRDTYARLINLAYPIVKSYKFKMGAGNEELFTAQANGFMYQYILDNCSFDILDLHLQGSCSTAEFMEMWGEEIGLWISYWKKPVEITEAFYGSVNKDFSLLLLQLSYAEKWGAENFANVFNVMDKGAFPDSMQKFVEDWIDMGLCFSVVNHPELTSSYYNEWKRIIEEKAPVPNIKRGVIDMIIKTIGWKPTDVKSGYGCLLLNEVLNYLDYLEEDYVDFAFSDKTKAALLKWQTDVNPLYGNSIDGRCGRMTWRYLKKEVKKIDLDAYNDLREDFQIIMSPYNVNGDT